MDPTAALDVFLRALYILLAIGGVAVLVEAWISADRPPQIHSTTKPCPTKRCEKCFGPMFGRWECNHEFCATWKTHHETIGPQND